MNIIDLDELKKKSVWATLKNPKRFCKVITLDDLMKATIVQVNVGICHNQNNDFKECDQFVCSCCGIELQDWVRIERDEEGEALLEYEFKYCPNCGSRVVEK